MAMSNSILSYEKEEDLLQRAIDSPKGLRISFETQKAATYFIHRANKFRSLDRERNKKIYTEPAHQMHGASVFDRLTLRKDENDPSTVIFEKLPATEQRATVEELE